MKELRSLVLRYAIGQIGYSDFRERMLSEFLSACNSDAMIEGAASAIDAECADFSERLISEDDLKMNLIGAIQPAPRTVARNEMQCVLIETTLGSELFPAVGKVVAVDTREALEALRAERATTRAAYAGTLPWFMVPGVVTGDRIEEVPSVDEVHQAAAAPREPWVRKGVSFAQLLSAEDLATWNALHTASDASGH